jgi:Clostripain family
MADKEWTVMFFFAGDNALSPLIVSQLKALKDAGFHEDVDVLAHFDSNEAGVPTRVFNVNSKRKQVRRVMIGDGRDSFVRNLIDDDVRPREIIGGPETSSGKLRAALKYPDTSTAADALRNFLGFCREYHRAKNYILFLVGHGVVVGNDAFLPDDNPVSAISLDDLRTILSDFNDDEKKGGGTLQLLALHSCGMSAVEVAYQLKGTAKYMIGAEGISYVESWPHRQLLKKIFNFVDRAKGGSRRHDDDNDGEENEANDPHANDPRRLVEKLYFHSLFNAADFMISGYSLDLGLCNLDPQNFDSPDSLSDKMRALVARLKRALESGRGKELILLAHWDSQSYWGENYTDLYDFCRCLRERCRLALGMVKKYGDEAKTVDIRAELEGLMTACYGVMTLLDREDSKDLAERFSKLIVHSCHFGPKYQYSHGLSIYFPWSRPIDDTEALALAQIRALQSGRGTEVQGIMERYRDYAFNTELERGAAGQSWFSFLDSYFDKTQRKPRLEEEQKRRVDGDLEGPNDEAGVFSIPGLSGSVGAQSDNPTSALIGDKPTPSTGPSCTCPSIKNYVNDITISKSLLRVLT